MDEKRFLAEQFAAHRAHLRAVAYRMLGSLSEAEDAVQEAWLRLSRADTSDVANLRGWLTTVVARLSLDMLRSRKARREEPWDTDAPENDRSHAPGADPEEEAMMADAVGLALLVVLEKLTPAERLAFVLHDMFAVPFDEIASIVDRSPVATRQLASRARGKVQGKPAVPDASRSRRREVLDAFLAASRGGDFEALLTILDPEVVFRADPAAIAMGGAPLPRGAEGVARFFAGRAQAAQPAFIDGAMGIVVAPNGRLMLVLDVTVENGKITEISATADPHRLRQFDIAVEEK